MTTVNGHIDLNTLDNFSKNKFDLKSAAEIALFQTWLDEQPKKIFFVQDAMEAYRNGIKPVTADPEPVKKTYSQSDFKSRQQLNSFLKRNGYTWHQIAPMNENEESRYGECSRWQLYFGDRAVTVNEALAAIAAI